LLVIGEVTLFAENRKTLQAAGNSCCIR